MGDPILCVDQRRSLLIDTRVSFDRVITALRNAQPPSESAAGRARDFEILYSTFVLESTGG